MTEVVTPPNFVGGLGIDLWIEGDVARARCEVQPAFFKPGTDRIRMGVLATLVDMVAGSPRTRSSTRPSTSGCRCWTARRRAA